MGQNRDDHQASNGSNFHKKSNTLEKNDSVLVTTVKSHTFDKVITHFKDEYIFLLVTHVLESHSPSAGQRCPVVYELNIELLGLALWPFKW